MKFLCLFVLYIIHSVSLNVVNAGERSGGTIGLNAMPNRPIQIVADRDCSGSACAIVSSALTQVGRPIAISARPNSTLLIECTFQANVQLIREINTVGNFQLHQVGGMHGSRAVSGVFNLYSVLSSYGAATGAPVSLRALVQSNGHGPQLFNVLASGSGVSIPLVSITDKICTITELN